ncbi:MAG TPA: peptidylprolyl isomerase [Candidatus Eisenbacteria bacterium]|jgi:cyclophilin family peptidyl-prolyl cis-trans isomerase
MKGLWISLVALSLYGVAAAADSTAVAPAKTPPTMKDGAMQQIESMIASAKVDTKKPRWRTALSIPTAAPIDSAHKYMPTPVKFDSTHRYYARMVTNMGPILIRFMPEVAPMHVTSFIYLSKLGFYDGLTFHRVIPGFMAQGGCPLGTGTGGPGYKFAGEFSPSVKHDRPGLLSMANAGPGTDGSQFFLTFVPTMFLDGKHTIFGEVVEGMDVLKKLEAAGSQSGMPKEPLLINKVTIEVK